MTDRAAERVTMRKLFVGSPTPFERSAASFGATGDRYVCEYVMLPMADGVRLATYICRPRLPGRHPVVMERTPYKPELSFPSELRRREIYGRLLAAGYAIVIQNERGTQWSEGDFAFLGGTAADAQDTLTWLEGQEWCNGRVATMGCSSPAENQLVLGATGHSALKAQIAMSSGAGIGDIPGAEGRKGLFYRNGVPMLQTWASWYAPFGFTQRPKLPVSDDPEETVRFMRSYNVQSLDTLQDGEYTKELVKSTKVPPSRDALRRLGVPRSGFDEYITVGPGDGAWDGPDFIHARHTGATPALNINGWLDVGAYETVKLFEFQAHHPDQYLIMAPTRHCTMVTDAAEQAWLGERPMGDTRFPYDDIFMAWFGRWLREDEAGWKPMPKVQVFLMGAGTWLVGDVWPLPDTSVTTRYLGSRSGANTLWGDGLLAEEPRADWSPADSFLSDPRNPVPTCGGGLAGDSPVCVDQRAVECRSDVLVYSSGPLETGEAMVGDLEATLFVSTDVRDTDIHVKLVDVYPDGTAFNVAETCLRLRYRDGYGSPTLVDENKIYKVSIGGITTANYFGAGHQIRVEIAGSNFPLCDRNWNTGGNGAEETSGPIAHVTVHHSGEHQSCISYRRYQGPLTVSGGHPLFRPDGPTGERGPQGRGDT